MNNSKITSCSFSELQKYCQEISRLQKENLDLLIELEFTHSKLRHAMHLAEIKEKRYAGIKKLFQ